MGEKKKKGRKEWNNNQAMSNVCVALKKIFFGHSSVQHAGSGSQTRNRTCAPCSGSIVLTPGPGTLTRPGTFTRTACPLVIQPVTSQLGH